MKQRCQALDIEGRQCRREAKWHEQYHGDDELYSTFNERPRWVRVAFCDAHASDNHVNKKPIRKKAGALCPHP